jgi:hypothetical protein
VSETTYGLYDAQTYANTAAGGTPLSASRLNHTEAGIADTSRTVLDLIDDVRALQGALDTSGRPVSGPSSLRGFPDDGRFFYDTDLDKPIWGNGSVWKDAAGTAVATSGGGGTTGGPTNFSAVVQPDSSVVLSWTLPAGTITGVTVREKFKSPGGVAGMPLAGSATTNTRAASTATAVREYYVTCTIGGVETAESNHVTVYLPYGTAPPDDAGGGGGTVGGGTGAGSPAAVLALGALPKTGGRYNLGVGRPSGHVDIPVSTVESGYIEEDYFYLNPAGTGVTFRCHPDGAKTSTNTKYPRTEMREYRQNGTDKAAWPANSGSHEFEYEWSVGQIWPNKCVTTMGQIHDASSDAMAIKMSGTDRTSLDVVAVFYDTVHPTKLLTGYDATQGDLAAHHTIKVNVSGGGVCKIYMDGALKITSTAMQGKGAGHYWKYGAYGQSAVSAGGNEPSSSRTDVTYYSHKTTHNPAH